MTNPTPTADQINAFERLAKLSTDYGTKCIEKMLDQPWNGKWKKGCVLLRKLFGER